MVFVKKSLTLLSLSYIVIALKTYCRYQLYILLCNRSRGEIAAYVAYNFAFNFFEALTSTLIYRLLSFST